MTEKGEEEQQPPPKLIDERKVLKIVLQSAIKGDYGTLQTTVDDYIKKHNNQHKNEGPVGADKKERLKETPFQLLQKFKDPKTKRTPLHLACQSPPLPASSSSEKDNDSESKNDIVSMIICDESWFPSSPNKSNDGVDDDEGDSEDKRNNGSSSLSLLESLLKIKDKDGMTPIMLAAQHSHPKLGESRVLAILNKMSPSNVKLGLARSKSGATPLHYAAGAGATPATIKAIYKSGAVAIKTFALKGGTPLHWACAAACSSSENGNTKMKGSLPTITALLKCGANPNAKSDNIPMTPLDLVVKQRHVECVRLLLSYASTTARGDESSTPIITEDDAKAYIERHNKDFNTEQSTNTNQPNVTISTGSHKINVEVSSVNDGQKKEKKKSKKSRKKETNSSSTIKDPIEVKAHKQATNIIQLSSDNSISQDDINKSLQFKQKGNTCFQKKGWQLAVEHYSQAISVNPMEATFYSNRSSCYLSLELPELALEDAIIAKSLKGDWSKAYYRVALARYSLGRYEDAAIAAFEGLRLDSQNKDLKKLLKKCVSEGRQQYQQQQQQEQQMSNDKTTTATVQPTGDKMNCNNNTRC